MSTNKEKMPMTVFVGSSLQSKTRFQLQEKLIPKLEAEIRDIRPWWKVFKPGKTGIQTLVYEAANSDLAIFVMAQDDLVRTTDNSLVFKVRDNVTFELGLFAGALGMDRSLMVVAPPPPASLPRARGRVTSGSPSAEDLRIATDLEGVVQIRWTEDTGWDGVAQSIVDKARERFDRLGLGWWIMESLNRSVKPPRCMFGFFNMVSSGMGVRVQDGVLHYGASFHASGIVGEVRERWHSVYASYVEPEKSANKLMIVADVQGHPHHSDPLPEAHGAGNFKTVYQAEQSGDERWFFGKFFNIENLTFKGDATFKRLGPVSERAAFRRAIIEFAPALLLKQSPCLKQKLQDDDC
jgi:predicted nucleotide-binding protein